MTESSSNMTIRLTVFDRRGLRQPRMRYVGYIQYSGDKLMGFLTYHHNSKNDRASMWSHGQNLCKDVSDILTMYYVRVQN